MEPKSEARRKTQRHRLRVSAIALLLSLFGLVLGTGLLALRTGQSSDQSLRQAGLSLQLRQLQTLLVSLADAERSQRGYLLTGDPAFLAPYRQALQHLPDLVVSLDQVPLANTTAARHAALAREAIEARFTELDKAIQLQDRGQAAAALALVQADSDQQRMDLARGHITAVIEQIRGERDRLNLLVAEDSRETRQLAVVAMSALLLFMAIAAVQILLLYRSQLRHEEALQDNEDFLARTGGLAGVGGWEIDLHKQTARWSDAMRRIHEVDDAFQPTPDSALAFFSKADQALIRNALADSAETGKPWELELPLTTASGRRIWVRAVGETRVDEQGRALRHVGALQDVTERKLLARQLAEQVRFVREITDSLPLRIAYLDRGGRYQFVNAAHCRRFGLPREDIVGRSRSELTGGASDAVVQPHFQAVLGGQAQCFEYEETVDGQPRQVESQLIPDLDTEGHVRGVYATGVDITERKLAERALRDLAEILHNTPDNVVQTDWTGRITYMNPAARRSLGLAADAPVEGRLFSEFNTPETNQRFQREIAPAAKQHGFWIGETTVLTATDAAGPAATGTAGPAASTTAMPVSQVVIAHRDSSGRIARYSSVMRDLRAEHAAREALQRQAAALRGIIEAIPAFVAVVGADRRYRYVNHAFERWIGRPREALIGHSVADVLDAEALELSRPWMDRALAGETVSFERRHAAAKGTQHLALTYIPLRLDDGRIDGFIGVVQDITVHKEEEVRLLRLTERDALTGLLNRAGFEAWGQAKIAEGAAARLALLYIDLDHFKLVNDRHGHAVGDELLREFAQRLLRQVRPSDAVARLGGDEFAIALSGARELAHAEAVADKVVDASLAPFEIGTLRLFASASVGVALDAQQEGGWSGLLARADAAVYRAKSAGRSRRA